LATSDLTDFTFLAANFNQSLSSNGGGSLGPWSPNPPRSRRWQLSAAYCRAGVVGDCYRNVFTAEAQRTQRKKGLNFF
jgi:hypothetical protein